jgi:hypothetical protein
MLENDLEEVNDLDLDLGSRDSVRKTVCEDIDRRFWSDSIITLVK